MFVQILVFFARPNPPKRTQQGYVCLAIHEAYIGFLLGYTADLTGVPQEILAFLADHRCTYL